MKLHLLLALALCSCQATTTLYQPGVQDGKGKGVPLAKIASNMTGVSLAGGGIQFSAATIDNATPTLAHGEAVGHVITKTGDMVQKIYVGAAGLELVKGATQVKLGDQSVEKTGITETTKRAVNDNATKTKLAEIAAEAAAAP